MIKNKKGLLPLIILIPLMLVGLIIFYFILKALIGIVIKTVMWTLALGFVVLIGFIIYYIIRWALRKRKGGNQY